MKTKKAKIIAISAVIAVLVISIVTVLIMKINAVTNEVNSEPGNITYTEVNLPVIHETDTAQMLPGGGYVDQYYCTVTYNGSEVTLTRPDMVDLKTVRAYVKTVFSKGGSVISKKLVTSEASSEN